MSKCLPSHNDQIEKMIQYCDTQTRKLENILHQQNPNIFNFSREKRLNCNIGSKITRMEDVLVIYFEQIVSCCAPICSILASIRVNS